MLCGYNIVYKKGDKIMFSSVNAVLVVIILEVILCVYSLVLGYMSEKKFGKVLNFGLSVIWAVAAILNVIAL